jgi:hypothetical protein
VRQAGNIPRLHWQKEHAAPECSADELKGNTLGALAARQGRLGGNLLWGSWTPGPWELQHRLSLLFVASGTLMFSNTLRIPKL